MRPVNQIALQKLAMMCGMFVCFGVALAAYNRFRVNVALLPLWVNLVAYVGPVLVGMFLGHWLLSRVPVVCPTCRARIERRRVEGEKWWRMPTYRYWCEACQRNGLDGIHGPTTRSSKASATRDTDW